MGRVLFCVCVACVCITHGLSQTVYDFDILADALINTSPRLKQNEVDILIASENIGVARAGYYPNLKLVTNMEYSKKFEGMFVPSYVGDDSLTQTSGRYMSSSLYLSYEIYHFGATTYSATAARENMYATVAAKCVKEKEYLLSLLEAYSKVRIANYQLEEYGKIQELYSELYASTKRLYESGRLAKTNSMEYAKELADVVTLIVNIKEEQENYLSEITYLSGIKVTNNDVFLSLNANDLQYQPVKFEDSATARQLMAIITQKEAKVKSARTKYFPTISLYGRYDMYGSSEDSYRKAYDDLEKNGYRIGISLSWALFDGFRDIAEANINIHELTQSRYAYEETQRVYAKEQYMIDSQISFQQDRLYGIAQSIQASDELIRADNSLYAVGELDRITLLNNQIGHHKIMLSHKETSELLFMNIKKKEIINRKESECIAR